MCQILIMTCSPVSEAGLNNHDNIGTAEDMLKERCSSSSAAWLVMFAGPGDAPWVTNNGETQYSIALRYPEVACNHSWNCK